MLSEPTTADEVLQRARRAQAWKRSLGRKPVFSPASDPPAPIPPQPEPTKIEFVPYLGIRSYPDRLNADGERKEEAARTRLFMRDVIRGVAKHFAVKTRDLVSARRTKELIFPRHIAMFLCKELTPSSFPCIGREFGRDHTTVLYAFGKIEARAQEDASFCAELNAILAGMEATHGCVLRRY